MARAGRIRPTSPPSTKPGDEAPWQQFGRAFSSEPGFITRGWIVNGQTLWDQALDGGLLNLIATDQIATDQIATDQIATDQIEGSTWAMVGETPYRAMPLCLSDAKRSVDSTAEDFMTADDAIPALGHRANGTAQRPPLARRGMTSSGDSPS